jgi:hypothetical protein
MTECPQCSARLTARDGSGAAIEVYCIRDDGHTGMHRGDVMWSSPVPYPAGVTATYPVRDDTI